MTDIEGLDVVLAALAHDFQELDERVSAELDAARVTESRLDDVALRLEALK